MRQGQETKEWTVRRQQYNSKEKSDSRQQSTACAETEGGLAGWQMQRDCGALLVPGGGVGQEHGCPTALHLLGRKVGDPQTCKVPVLNVALLNSSH